MCDLGKCTKERIISNTNEETNLPPKFVHMHTLLVDPGCFLQSLQTWLDPEE